MLNRRQVELRQPSRRRPSHRARRHGDAFQGPARIFERIAARVFVTAIGPHTDVIVAG